MLKFIFCTFLFLGYLPSCFSACSDMWFTWTDSTFSMPDVSVQYDAPVGTVIGTASGKQGNIYTYGCEVMAVMDYNGALKSSLDHVYKTNVDGVGVKVSVVTNTAPTTYAESSPGGDLEYISGNKYLYPPSIKLVKTGPMKSGVLTGGVVFHLAGIDGQGQRVSWSFSNSPTITVLACSATSGSTLTFPLGNIPANQFASVGSVSQQTNTQNLGLNCDAGANINVTLNGVQNPDTSDDSVLALSGGTGVASGIGVQLLYGGQPIELNKILKLKTSGGGQESFPITARYYQTKSQVMPGAANTTATLNLTYQ